MGKHMIHSLGGSKSFGRLSLKAKVLWPMLIAECDDQGRFDAEPEAIKWAVCQNVDEIAVDEISVLLTEMISQGMLIVYGTSSEYGQVVRWWLHQPMAYARPSKYPAPDGWTDRIRYKVSKEVHPDGWIKRNWNDDGGFANGKPNVSDTIRTKEKKRKESKVKEKKGGSRKRDPRLDHEAIIGYKELARLHIPIILRDDWIKCAEEVGTGPLLKVVRDWIGRGYGPKNIDGMMSVAREGWRDGTHQPSDDGLTDWTKRHAHRFGPKPSGS